MLTLKPSKFCMFVSLLLMVFIFCKNSLDHFVLRAARNTFKEQQRNSRKVDEDETNVQHIESQMKDNASAIKVVFKATLAEEMLDFPPAKVETRNESCVKQEVVVFIKTHKTGSSTITNILNRFADIHDLKIALPMVKFYRFHWPKPFHWSAVDLWRLDGDTPSILCNHARYNRATIQLIMRKGAKFITILRNPAQQYESLFNYMEFKNFLLLNSSTNPLEDFLENPVPQLYKMRARFRGIPETMNLVKNPMLFDLGMYPPEYYNITRVRNTINKLDRDFELVLIMEYFDESLIVLKKAMCWTMEDILYVKFNQRKNGSTQKLSENVMQSILKWNGGDVMLYEFFNKTLWEKIRAYGPSFWQDLKDFRELNSRMQDSCVAKQSVLEKAFHLSGSVVSFRLNPDVSVHDRYLCMKILRNEVDYIQYFRTKYKPYGAYQTMLEKEGRKKSSTRELINRLHIAANVRFADSVPSAVTR